MFMLTFCACMSLQAQKVGMKVRFLGTGAADWEGIDERGEIRRCSSILVDGAVLVDLTAQAVDMIPDGCKPEVIFYTHSHRDHFDPETAVKLGVSRVYVGASWIGRARSKFREASFSVGTVLRTVHVLTKTGRYTPPEGMPVYLTHLARTLHGTQAELDATLPQPLKAAYDGLEVTFEM